MLKFISFGSGSSGNCYYLFTDNGGILIDVGVGLRALKRQFCDYGLNYFGGFDNILLTHDHADHIKSVGSLSKKFNIAVWATKEVHAGVDANYSVKCKLVRDNRRYIIKGVPFVIGDMHITPFGVPHDSRDNVGYMIECDGVVFSLLTDVGHITDEMRLVIQNSNYLVIESNYEPKMLAEGPYPLYLQQRISNGHGHLSNQQCAKTLAENYTPKLKHVWLCHLSEENNTPDLAFKRVEEGLLEANIPVGKQLKLDVLRRKLPTGVFNLE